MPPQRDSLAPWNFDGVLGDGLVTVVFRDKHNRNFPVEVGASLRPIKLAIEVSGETGRAACRQSHAPVTPLCYRAEQPGFRLRDTLTFDPASRCTKAWT